MAATEGSTCFLLLPTTFWVLPDVAPLVRTLVARCCRLGQTHNLLPPLGPACCGAGMACRGTKEPAPAQHLILCVLCLPACLAACLHVRFSFDRAPLRRMQQAIAAAGQQQLAQAACWLPPGGALVQQQGGSSHGGGSEAVAAEQARFDLLQPEADAVAAVAASMEEQGSQRLNAEQRQAVAAVVCGAGRAMPFALFGPPGVFWPLQSNIAIYCIEVLLWAWQASLQALLTAHLDLLLTLLALLQAQARQ